MKILLFLLLPLTIHAFDYETRIKMEYYLLQNCIENEVPISVAYKLIQWESKWDSKAVNCNSNGTKDLGIMQLNNAYIKYFSDKYNGGVLIDVWMWRVSIKVGVLYLRDLYIATGNWPAAIASYNMGLTKYKQYIKNKTNLPLKTIEMINFIFD